MIKGSLNLIIILPFLFAIISLCGCSLKTVKKISNEEVSDLLLKEIPLRYFNSASFSLNKPALKKIFSEGNYCLYIYGNTTSHSMIYYLILGLPNKLQLVKKNESAKENNKRLDAFFEKIGSEISEGKKSDVYKEVRKMIDANITSKKTGKALRDF